MTTPSPAHPLGPETEEAATLLRLAAGSLRVASEMEAQAQLQRGRSRAPVCPCVSRPPSGGVDPVSAAAHH